MHAGGWQTTIGPALEGKVLGIIGLGNLGSQVATVGRAFGMDVVAWSQNLTGSGAPSSARGWLPRRSYSRKPTSSLSTLY